MAKKERFRHPPNWMAKAFRLLAAGKYAALWVPEFLELYEIVLREEGRRRADEVALEEIFQSVPVSVALRTYRVLRIAYLGWKLYRKIARR